MPPTPGISGTAALSIAESLVLALGDNNILPREQLLEVLRSASATYEKTDGTSPDLGFNAAVFGEINRIAGQLRIGRFR